MAESLPLENVKTLPKKVLEVSVTDNVKLNITKLIIMLKTVIIAHSVQDKTAEDVECHMS